MEFIKFLLSGHLILIFVTAFSSDGNPNIEFDILFDTAVPELTADFRLPAHIVPRHYDIELDIDMYTFHGKCNISLDTTKINTHNLPSNISLHSVNLIITNATLIKGVGANAFIMYNLHDIIYVTKQEIAILDFKHKLSPIYNYTLNIVFSGIVAESGGLFKTSITSYVNRDGHKEWVIATRNSAIGTRRLFPCWDEPGLKANFTINLKYHNSYTALSNMPVISSRRSKDNKIMARFATTPAIPTYLVAIVLIRLSVISFTADFQLWSRRQVRENIRDAGGIITNFTQAFENEWPILGKFLREQHFAIPGWLDDGMDKWQMVFYREENIIYNKELDPIARKIEVSRLIARKLASQLIGSVTRASWWSHMWLHEGIATLLGMDIINKNIPDFRIMDLFVIQTLQESLYLDDYYIMDSLTSEVNNMFELNSLFTLPYYLKGPAILRMLQHLIGIKVFQKGINIYLRKQSASPNDFWSAMQAAHNEAVVTGQFNITAMIEPWIKKYHYPILDVMQYSDYYTILVNVSIYNTPDARWIPVTYTTQPDINFNALVGRLLQPPVPYLVFGFDASYSEDNWIIFNIQQVGYYRVNYDDKSWKKIARFLSSENYTEIHVLNRAQIIDDAFHFMMMGKLNSSIFWELTSYLSQETDYVAWYPMLKVIERMSYIYPFPESQVKIKEMVLSRLVPLLRKIGYKECHPDENNEECPKDENHLLKSLRQEAAKWACVFGDVDCRREANAKLRSDLLNLAIDYSLPWWRKWTFCHGLSTADNVTINKVYDIYLNQSDTKILEFLTCSDNYCQVISMFMEGMTLAPRRGSSTRVKEQNKIIPRDYINMFHYIVERYPNNESALNFILSNWVEIKPEKMSTTAALIDIINHVYSPNHLDKIKNFVENMHRRILTDADHKFSGTDVVGLAFTRQEIYEMIKNNYVNVLMLNIKSKIDLRLSQIKRHKNTDSLVFMYV
ncbi:aminopeptidase N-like [Temnothorax americanus]|uniref:aminopeptidase N-like n=1 Tax=Temnothorax americanus TaxID=1964332 RepID=UPI004068581F